MSSLSCPIHTQRGISAQSIAYYRKVLDNFFKRALPYIEMGWPVFPTRPDKRPLCPHGRLDATCVSLAIEAWSDEFPEANISIKTGKASGVCVIDIDSEDGEQWIRAVNRSWAKLPDTAEARSGRGRHLYFAYPNLLTVKSANGKLARGIDLRASGGSITAPISLHASGKLYEWVKPPFGKQLPPLPGWVVSSLRAKERPVLRTAEYERPPSNEHISSLLNQIVSASMGTRNQTLNRVAFIFGLMAKAGHITENQARSWLENAGKSAGLEATEVLTTIKSGLRSALRSRPRR